MERCRLFLDIFYDHHLECELNDSCEGIDIHPLRGGVGECDSGWGVWRWLTMYTAKNPPNKNPAKTSCQWCMWSLTLDSPNSSDTMKQPDWMKGFRKEPPSLMSDSKYTCKKKKHSVTLRLTFKVEFKDCGVNIVTIIYVILDNNELSWTLFCFFFGNFLFHILIINVWTKNG